MDYGFDECYVGIGNGHNVCEDPERGREGPVRRKPKYALTIHDIWEVASVK